MYGVIPFAEIGFDMLWLGFTYQFCRIVSEWPAIGSA